MPRGEASILASYECARRAPLESNKWAYAKGAPRLKCAGEMFRCVTCNLDAVCRSCIKWCHVQKGHEVKGRKVEVAKKKERVVDRAGGGCASARWDHPVASCSVCARSYPGETRKRR